MKSNEKKPRISDSKIYGEVISGPTLYKDFLKERERAEFAISREVNLNWELTEKDREKKELLSCIRHVEGEVFGLRKRNAYLEERLQSLWEKPSHSRIKLLLWRILNAFKKE